MNTIDATFEGDKAITVLGRQIDVAEYVGERSTAPIVFGIRPEDLNSCPPEEAWFSGEVVVAERLGSQTYAYLEVGDTRMLTVELPRDADITVGEMIHVRGETSSVHLFDKSTGRRLNNGAV
jgi:sn-glycerol 3-phosphate transport system ATP-binding protein